MRNKGFTLVELLIVLSIIGILTAIVVASTSASRTKARDTRRIGDLKEIQLGLAVYYDVNKAYPTTGNLNNLVTQGYIPTALPLDPLGSSYEYSSVGSTYCLGTVLENLSSLPADNSSCSTGGSANYKVQPPTN